MKKLLFLFLLSGLLFSQTWTEFPTNGNGFLEAFRLRTRCFFFQGKIYRNACDSGFNDRLSEADTTQRKWIANYQRPSYGIYGDANFSIYPYDTQTITHNTTIWVYSWSGYKLKVAVKRDTAQWTNEEVDLPGTNSNRSISRTAIFDSLNYRVYIPGNTRTLSGTKYAMVIAINPGNNFYAGEQYMWSSVGYVLDDPRALFSLNNEYYIITTKMNYNEAYPPVKGVKIKKRIGTDWTQWEELFAFDSLKSILDVKQVRQKIYFIADNGNDRSEAGLYEFDGATLKKISNWADSLYVTGLYADENELLVSVSEALIGGNPKLHQRSYGKWNKTAFNLPYASNNIVRENNRIWIWRTYDIYNFLPYLGSENFYYTDNIPKLPDTRFLTLKKRE